jgi:hypothetical protein
MKIAMIHNGKGVDQAVKEAVVWKIKKYNETNKIHIKTARVDFLGQLYEDLSFSSEKMQLVIFLDVRADLIKAAKESMPTLRYPVYFVRVGNTIESNEAQESVRSIEDWDAKPFLKFIDFIHS